MKLDVGKGGEEIVAERLFCLSQDRQAMLSGAVLDSGTQPAATFLPTGDLRGIVPSPRSHKSSQLFASRRIPLDET